MWLGICIFNCIFAVEQFLVCTVPQLSLWAELLVLLLILLIHLRGILNGYLDACLVQVQSANRRVILKTCVLMQVWGLSKPLVGLWWFLLTSSRLIFKSFVSIMIKRLLNLVFLCWGLWENHRHKIHIVLFPGSRVLLLLLLTNCSLFSQAIRGVDLSFNLNYLRWLISLLRLYHVLRWCYLGPGRHGIKVLNLLCSHEKCLLNELLNSLILHLVRSQRDIYQVIQVSIFDDLNYLSGVEFVRQKLWLSVRCIAWMMSHNHPVIWLDLIRLENRIVDLSEAVWLLTGDATSRVVCCTLARPPYLSYR
jgi:hypothetical protein